LVGEAKGVAVGVKEGIADAVSDARGASGVADTSVKTGVVVIGLSVSIGVHADNASTTPATLTPNKKDSGYAIFMSKLLVANLDRTKIHK
jgi:hypothetical protein